MKQLGKPVGKKPCGTAPQVIVEEPIDYRRSQGQQQKKAPPQCGRATQFYIET
jgi:hypothetical protein